jgi:stage IV sporulation protein FB
VNFLQPTPTPFDLRFRLFGTPVRIHPTFWLVGALLGYIIVPRGRLDSILIYIGCFLAAILVHELGHALMARAFRERLQIVLFGFGGMAGGISQRLGGRQRILIALAGPAAGFLFLLVTHESSVWLERYLTDNPQALGVRAKTNLRDAIKYLWFMNLFWNVMNLLPIYPLDGGQVVREVCLGAAPSRGVQISLGLSFFCAAGVAVYSILKMQRPDLWYPQLDPLFNLIFFGLMALENLMMLRSAKAEQRRLPATEEAW